MCIFSVTWIILVHDVLALLIINGDGLFGLFGFTSAMSVVISAVVLYIYTFIFCGDCCIHSHTQCQARHRQRTRCSCTRAPGCRRSPSRTPSSPSASSSSPTTPSSPQPQTSSHSSHGNPPAHSSSSQAAGTFPTSTSSRTSGPSQTGSESMSSKAAASWAYVPERTLPVPR